VRGDIKSVVLWECVSCKEQKYRQESFFFNLACIGLGINFVGRDCTPAGDGGSRSQKESAW